MSKLQAEGKQWPSQPGTRINARAVSKAVPYLTSCWGARNEHDFASQGGGKERKRAVF